MIKIRNKNTSKMVIPKDSKFKELRQLLPKEFEWITTKNRIVKEGISMHHCVASYAKKVNADRCAIYSFVYKNERRYTIEFTKGKSGYYIEQIQGCCDSGCPEEVRNYRKRRKTHGFNRGI